MCDQLLGKFGRRIEPSVQCCLLWTVYPERIVIAAEGRILCEHGRIIARSHHLPGRIVYDWRHYLAVIQRKPGALRNGAPFTEMPDAFRQLQGHLLKHPGGDREIVEILALVLQHDEQAVTCAVELALALRGGSLSTLPGCAIKCTLFAPCGIPAA